MPFQGIRTRLADLWRRDIWQTTLHSDRSPKGWLYAVLRVFSIVCTTFSQTRTASRSADLSFSSMLGLGPLVAIGMLVASTIFGQRNPHLAVDLLQRVISFVAPQLNQIDSAPNAGDVPVNPDLVALINGFIRGARSSTVGVLGSLSLVLIVLFLFKSIEDVFNDIWGVRRGRTLLRRVAFYWTLLTLGGLLFFAAVAVFAVGQFVNVLVGSVPIGIAMAHLARWSLPPLSFILLVGVLAAFYRAIPNTRVRWGAALTGAVAVALLLTANNYVQFLYLRRVLLAKSLFGSLGIIPVLMFGLYVFWMIVLIGGQISYAVQNVDVRNSKLAWNSLSVANRERLSMALLMAICRSFRAGKPSVSAAELASATQPAHPAPERVPEPGRRPRVRAVRAGLARGRRHGRPLPALAPSRGDHAPQVQGGLAGQPRLRPRRRRPRQDRPGRGAVQRGHGAPRRGGLLPRVRRAAPLGGKRHQIKRCQSRAAI